MSNFRQSLVESESRSLRPCCRYCKVEDPLSLAKCLECNRWFCNTPFQSKGSHIIIHLTTNGHSRICFHRESKRMNLECYICHESNLFSLGYYKEAFEQKIICRGACYDNFRGIEANLHSERKLKSLIEERHFRNEFLTIPKSTFPVSLEEIENIEQTDNGVSIFKFPIFDSLPLAFDSIEAYKNIHQGLIDFQINFEKLKSEETKFITEIQWKNDKSGTFFLPDKLIGKYDKYIVLSYREWSANALITRVEGNKVQFKLKDSVPSEYSIKQFSILVQPDVGHLNRFSRSLNKLQEISSGLTEAILNGQIPSCSVESQVSHALPLIRLDFVQMNNNQREAIARAIYQPLTLIQGPPGTGKTTVAANIIKYKLAKFPSTKVLACAPSNTAVDNLAERMHNIGLKVLRFLSNTKSQSSVPHLTFKAFLQRNLRYKELAKLQGKIEDFEGFTNAEDRIYKAQIERALQEAFDSAEVVCCTCSTAADDRLNGFRYNFVLIDEATQSFELETICTLTLGANQLVLIGDQKQLGPTIMINDLKEAGYETSLYERFILNGSKPIMLNQQYRMHPSIVAFSNKNFYDGLINTMITVEDRTEHQFNDIWINPSHPIIFSKVTDTEEISISGVSLSNRFEYVAIEHYLRKFRLGGLNASDIGVISFYGGQVAEITRRLTRLSTKSEDLFYKEIEVSSVDGFQGKEKKYIILSCVRSNVGNKIGFVDDYRRMNVAITRAMFGLVIIGNSDVLSHSEVWKNFIKFLEIKRLIQTFTQTSPSCSSSSESDEETGRNIIRHSSSEDVINQILLTDLIQSSWQKQIDQTKQRKDKKTLKKANYLRNKALIAQQHEAAQFKQSFYEEDEISEEAKHNATKIVKEILLSKQLLTKRKKNTQIETLKGNYVQWLKNKIIQDKLNIDIDISPKSKFDEHQQLLATQQFEEHRSLLKNKLENASNQLNIRTESIHRKQFTLNQSNSGYREIPSNRNFSNVLQPDNYLDNFGIVYSVILQRNTPLTQTILKSGNYLIKILEILDAYPYCHELEFRIDSQISLYFSSYSEIISACVYDNSICVWKASKFVQYQLDYFEYVFGIRKNYSISSRKEKQFSIGISSMMWEITESDCPCTFSSNETSTKKKRKIRKAKKQGPNFCVFIILIIGILLIKMLMLGTE